MFQDSEIDQDDIPIHRDTLSTPFQHVLQKRLDRRSFIKATAVTSGWLMFGEAAWTTDTKTELTFKEVSHGLDEDLHIADHYTYQVLLRWGDSIFLDAPDFNPHQQSEKSQLRQFGYNNDFLEFLPITFNIENSKHGLLVVNHEYVNSRLMHPNSPNPFDLSKQQLATEMAAHGLSIIEVKQKKQVWEVVRSSKFNRRITPRTRTMFSGPAIGSDRVKAKFSADGKICLGTFANCAGSVTPWGTILTAEENIQAYFMGDALNTKEGKSYRRFGLLGDKTSLSAWAKLDSKWNINEHPQAGLHAGWIVEINPYDANFVPIKRTALGRCKHEGCGIHINKDQRIVIYMGDDQAFEYIYRFVSKRKYQPKDLQYNLSLLDEGELSVAEFKEDGKLIWHPLVWGQDPHTGDNGFSNQADVVIDMRYAADLVNATPMDRPEEIKVNPVSTHVFAVMTGNIKRDPLHLNAANSRPLNRHGHILELIAPDQDHTAAEFTWEVFVLAGNPKRLLDQAKYHPKLSKHGWFSNPDNCTFDGDGRLWVASDGFYRHGSADGIWVAEVQGTNKALFKQFLRAPHAAEICSPCFTPNRRTMFCSVQHPGGDSTFSKPSTRWPDFDKNIPPRPSVIAIKNNDGDVIGT